MEHVVKAETGVNVHLDGLGSPAMAVSVTNWTFSSYISAFMHYVCNT